MHVPQLYRIQVFNSPTKRFSCPNRKMQFFIVVILLISRYVQHFLLFMECHYTKYINKGLIYYISHVAIFCQVELVVHYENNAPFLTVSHMTRIIEVSHWGNIAVEESYDMVHTGAILKGPFSRYDYQRNQDGVSSIKSFKVSQ